MSTIHIPQGERGVIRIFAVNRPPEDITAILRTRSKSDLVRELLGDPDIDTKSAELFPVADLEGVGLASYLTDGYDVERDRIQVARARLDALEGFVLLLFSESFHGREITLAPGPDLTFIESLSEFQPDLSAPPLTAESAKPFTGTPGLSPPTPPRGRAGSALVGMALIAALIVIIWWLLS